VSGISAWTISKTHAQLHEMARAEPWLQVSISNLAGQEPAKADSAVGEQHSFPIAPDETGGFGQRGRRSAARSPDWSGVGPTRLENAANPGAQRSRRA
jgi:hypothetical protein